MSGLTAELVRIGTHEWVGNSASIVEGGIDAIGRIAVHDPSGRHQEIASTRPFAGTPALFGGWRPQAFVNALNRASACRQNAPLSMVSMEAPLAEPRRPTCFEHIRGWAKSRARNVLCPAWFDVGGPGRCWCWCPCF